MVNDSEQGKNRAAMAMTFSNRWWLRAIIQGSPRGMGGDGA